MALIKSFTDRFGGEHESAYFKILKTSVNALEPSCFVVIGVFVNEQARLGNKEPVEIIEVNIGDDFSHAYGSLAGVSWEKTYIYLKTQPEFAGATDA